MILSPNQNELPPEFQLVPVEGIELPTFGLQRRRRQINSRNISELYQRPILLAHLPPGRPRERCDTAGVGDEFVPGDVGGLDDGIVVVERRSRFFVNTVGTQAASSMPRPANHRNNRL